MIYWNQVAYEILTKLTEKIKNSTLESGFFLLAWPANVGKKTAVFEIINSLWVLPQDLMIIEDPGKLDGNLYQIKVDIPEKERVLHIQEKDFLNAGARQIVEFLSTTSFGNYKVVFIENIERMNISSANAFIKLSVITSIFKYFSNPSPYKTCCIFVVILKNWLTGSAIF